MKKNFITVAPHRRAFPKKRVFAGGGESSDSHLSEPSAPSPAGAGPHHPVLIVAIRAVPK